MDAKKFTSDGLSAKARMFFEEGSLSRRVVEVARLVKTTEPKLVALQPCFADMEDLFSISRQECSPEQNTRLVTRVIDYMIGILAVADVVFTTWHRYTRR